MIFLKNYSSCLKILNISDVAPVGSYVIPKKVLKHPLRNLGLYVSNYEKNIEIVKSFKFVIITQKLILSHLLIKYNK